ncbi:MAG: hypothetical protein MJE77_06660 [Proteobacteria bacterium]|nr:hypothetical protein [Pseudomonadota bacterium]
MKATITVCSACLRASCWHGEFYCDEYKEAGTVEKSIEDLRALDLEHESYWTREEDNE